MPLELAVVLTTCRIMRMRDTYNLYLRMRIRGPPARRRRGRVEKWAYAHAREDSQCCTGQRQRYKQSPWGCAAIICCRL